MTPAGSRGPVSATTQRTTKRKALLRDLYSTALGKKAPGVIGFEVSGKLDAEDYRDVLLPALEQAAATGEVRIVIVIPKFEGFSAGALWQDLKMGVGNWNAWKRIALVTDVEWMIHGTEWFGWMTPGEIKQFPLEERDAALTWAAG